MKKNILITCLLMLSITCFGGEIEPLKKSEIKTMSIEERQERVLILENRLNEIKAFNPEELSNKERRAIKKELRSINKELRLHDGGGIYISAGTIIIILLLIIIL